MSSVTDTVFLAYTVASSVLKRPLIALLLQNDNIQCCCSYAVSVFAMAKVCTLTFATQSKVFSLYWIYISVDVCVKDFIFISSLFGLNSSAYLCFSL